MTDNKITANNVPRVTEDQSGLKAMFDAVPAVGGNPAPAGQMVGHSAAFEAARRLIKGAFRRDGEDLSSNDRPRFSIPARPDQDDDLVLMDFLKQCRPPEQDLAGWQPIATCPIHHSVILQCWWAHSSTEARVFEGYLDRDGTWRKQLGDAIGSDMSPPAYWQHLPKAMPAREGE